MGFAVFLLVVAAIDGKPDQIVIDPVFSEHCLSEPTSSLDRLKASISASTGLEVIERSETFTGRQLASEFLQVSVFIRPSDSGCLMDVAIQDGYLRSSDQIPTFDGQFMYALSFDERDADAYFSNLAQRLGERAAWVAVGYDGRQ